MHYFFFFIREVSFRYLAIFFRLYFGILWDDFLIIFPFILVNIGNFSYYGVMNLNFFMHFLYTFYSTGYYSRKHVLHTECLNSRR